MTRPLKTNNSDYLSSSEIFTISGHAAQSACITTSYNTSHITSFILAMARFKSINTAASSYVSSAVHLCVLHAVSYNIHSSDFVKYVVGNSQYLYIPTYTLRILKDIATAVRSKNAIAGWTNGSIEPLNSSKEVFGLLLDLTRDDWTRVFSGTIFSKICIDGRLYNQFHTELTQTIGSINYETREFTFDGFVNFLSLSPQYFYTHKGEFPMFKGRLEFSTSGHLGIYRFRNTLFAELYNVNQASCKSLGRDSLDFMCCFLKLYSPSFYSGSTGEISCSTFLPGDVRLSLETLDFVDAYFYYISSTATVFVKANAMYKNKTVKEATPKHDLPEIDVSTLLAFLADNYNSSLSCNSY
jgi:hypothetical protein